MDNQELQNSVAKIAETLITTQRNPVSYTHLDVYKRQA